MAEPSRSALNDSPELLITVDVLIWALIENWVPMSRPVIKTKVKIMLTANTPGEPEGIIIINAATIMEKQANIPCIFRNPLKVNFFLPLPTASEPTTNPAINNAKIIPVIW